jgi:Fur family transcriptional regulator, zinc uptake regulator
MSEQGRDETFPAPGHDHATCIESALAAAEDTCRRQGLRLTPIRRRVLELVWQNHQPVGAYDLLEQLSREGKRAMPPTVYRALDFLVSAGLVHRLSTLNAYVGCSHPDHAHQGQFLICRDCRTVVEMESPNIGRSLQREAAALGFRVQVQNVELTGLCPECTAAH